MRVNKAIRMGVMTIAMIGVAFAAFATRTLWWPGGDATIVVESSGEDTTAEAQAETETLRLGKQARQNLELTSKPAIVQDYWRTVQIPGIIVDRPGESDRGVTSPAVGVIQEIHVFNGDIVRPGELLFTLELFSEYLQNTQSELFQATREIQLLGERLARLESAAQSGALAESRLIEAENQIRRQEALIQANRQVLLTRGLSPSQIESAAEGKFVSSIEIVAPPVQRSTLADSGSLSVPFPAFAQGAEHSNSGAAYEVQELTIELGQQVQAGQLLALLTNHQFLYIEGHAFKDEAPYLARAAAQGWEIDVEFTEDASDAWPPLDQTFQIRHLSNSIDSPSRTLDFFVALTNQARTYQKDGQTFLDWRFRPGQRVRLFVPVERFENVIAVPSAAVVREGPEAFVFRQNGDLFDRISVHVLHEDRRNIVIANDGSVTPGLFLAQNSAASLNRVLKAQAASGTPVNLHIHADGTVHAP